jgi:hypothetical protein
MLTVHLHFSMLLLRAPLFVRPGNVPNRGDDKGPMGGIRRKYGDMNRFTPARGRPPLYAKAVPLRGRRDRA